jgi:glycosyltransferase involved in cell wall biosynthesis
LTLKLSFAIPAYNEEAHIAHCLDSLIQQNFSGEWEVIVCLNACTDATEAVIQHWSAVHCRPVKIVHEPRKGVSRARQMAFKNATGDIIVSADADTQYPPQWAVRIAEAFVDDERLVGFYGPVRLRDFRGPARLLVTGFQWILNDLFTFFGRWIGWHNVIGSNLAVRREAFDRVGGFNVSLGAMEDNEIVQRLKRIGRVRFDARLVAYASARRYNQFGFFRTVSFYFRNGIKAIFLKQATEDLEELGRI